MRDELDEKIITKFAALRPKAYSYLTDDNDENKKEKRTKKWVTERKLEFENYKHCLEAARLENKINRCSNNHKELIKKQQNNIKITANILKQKT